MTDAIPTLDWVDQLVELHVLAANGDTDAAHRAQQWVATDPAARAVWDGVERDCARVRQPDAGS